MTKIDLSILKSVPQLSVNAELRIEPLAPLSMVSELPGSFYKAMSRPDKKIICGLIENILGWHIDWRDRKSISKEIEKLRKKQKYEFRSYTQGSTYIPLLMDYFDLADDIKIDDFREINYFDDLWSRSYRRADSSKHINGCRYMDATMVDKWNRIKDLVEKDEKRKSKDKNSLLDKLFNRYIGKFPQYYSTPTVREYVDFNGVYLVPLKMDKSLYDMLSYEISNNNIGYLGNSEGWVNLKLTRL